MSKATTKGQQARATAKKGAAPYSKDAAPSAAAAAAAASGGGKGKRRAIPTVAATLFEKRPKNFSLGGNLQPARDVTRFVKWPKYIKLQRQKRVLQHRLKIPPQLNQFNRTLDKNHAVALFKLLHKYRPETKQQKAARLKAAAEHKVAGKAPLDPAKKPLFVKYGLNHVTDLVEQKTAKLVVIAHDVDPIELVLWLPALCRRQGVPYVIVKSKSRLGAVVHKKTASVLAVDAVAKDDQNELAQVVQFAKENFNERYDETRRQWGGGKLGIKSTAKFAQRQKAVAREQVMAGKL